MIVPCINAICGAAMKNGGLAPIFILHGMDFAYLAPPNRLTRVW